MRTPLARVADSYAHLGLRLLGDWRRHIAEIEAKPTPATADESVREAVACALLAAKSAFLIGSKTLDAIAVLKGPGHRSRVRTSTRAAPDDAELALVDDFANLHGRRCPSTRSASSGWTPRTATRASTCAPTPAGSRPGASAARSSSPRRPSSSTGCR